MEVKFSCGEDEIIEFLNNGWVIVEEYTEEKICSWNSIADNKVCDMEKDKGCKTKILDKIGKEKVYLLEKQYTIMTNKKEYLIELIFKKLKNNIPKKINVEKKEFTEFINSLLNNN